MLPTLTLTTPLAIVPGIYTVTAQFSEDVVNFVVGDVTITNGTVGNFVAVDANTYTFDVTPSANGIVLVDVAVNTAQDAVGNGNTAATQLSTTYDGILPTLSLTTGSANVNGVYTVTAEFSKNVTGFVIGDIVVVNGTKSNFVAVDGDTYTFDVTPTVDGNVTVDAAANIAQDAATNGNTASSILSMKK